VQLVYLPLICPFGFDLSVSITFIVMHFVLQNFFFNAALGKACCSSEITVSIENTLIVYFGLLKPEYLLTGNPFASHV
jgi:hypothetical protein